MADYPSSGALFKNDKKEQGSKHPDYTGPMELTAALLEELLALAKSNGGKVKADMASWIRDSSRGKFLSVTISPPYKKQSSGASKSSFDEAPF